FRPLDDRCLHRLAVRAAYSGDCRLAARRSGPPQRCRHGESNRVGCRALAGTCGRTPSCIPSLREISDTPGKKNGALHASYAEQLTCPLDRRGRFWYQRHRIRGRLRPLSWSVRLPMAADHARNIEQHRSNTRGHRLVQVIVRDNNVDQALKALKKKMQREGIFREMKLRGHYEKPSEKRAREKAEAIRRARKLARKRAQRESGVAPKPTTRPAP